jgi:hypothetical protein
MGDRIDKIRERHAAAESSGWPSVADVPGYVAHVHRGDLLAEVDRLTAENDVLRTEIANITASRQETQP